MSTESLDPLGRVFEGLYVEAWRLYKNKETDKAEALCRRLLTYPELGLLHKAGCHYMLGCGSDNYLEHAQKAVEIIPLLLVTTSAQAAKRKAFEQDARKALAKAERDHARIEKDFEQQQQAFEEIHDRRATNEELVDADMEKWCDEMTEHFIAVDNALEDQWTNPADEDDDGKDIDEEFQSIARLTPSPSPPLPPTAAGQSIAGPSTGAATPPPSSQAAAESEPKGPE